jgi:hypothetical protein
MLIREVFTINQKPPYVTMKTLYFYIISVSDHCELYLIASS